MSNPFVDAACANGAVMSQPAKSDKKRSLSGTQPTGNVHLGNYFGAIRQYIELQKQTECFYFVANFHGLTTIDDPEFLYSNSINIAKCFLSLGVDPNKSSLFLQSDVPQVTELAWYLSCFTSMGLLQRCHAFKDKVSQGIIPSHGLFAYPVLMAADILIFDADYVPVGEDQRQHIEVARDIAIKINTTYNTEVLRVPEPYILDTSAVVPGVDGRKMSKSYSNTIDIFAPSKVLKKQVMGIVTDSTPVEDPKNPDTNNVFNIYRVIASKEDTEIMRTRFLAGGYGYGDAKKALLEKILDIFGSARKRYEDYDKRPDEVRDVLNSGAQKARSASMETIDRVRRVLGFPLDVNRLNRWER